MRLRDKVLLFIGSVAIAVLLAFVVIRVDPSDLTWLLWLLTGLAWIQTIVLGRAGYGGPRIGALDERTFVGFVIALLGSVSCLIVTNTDLGKPYFTAETASVLFRLSILAVLAIPTVWLILWALGRLAPGRDR